MGSRLLLLGRIRSSVLSDSHWGLGVRLERLLERERVGLRSGERWFTSQNYKGNAYSNYIISLLFTDSLCFVLIIGNIVSFMVFLAPLPTFYTIYKNKSSEGFQSIPYVVALLSAMLLLYYGYLKTNAILIITINCIGCVIEVAYLLMYIIYAPRKHKISTLWMMLGADVGGLGITMIITTFIVRGDKRVHAVGWICAIFNIAVFAAPLSIMVTLYTYFHIQLLIFNTFTFNKHYTFFISIFLHELQRRVIKTKSVEYMPFSLSLFLTLCATMWFFYGLFDKDYYIMLPNVLGFLFGFAQMALYLIYKNANNKIENNIPEQQPEWGITVHTAHHDCDGNKTNFPSEMEMKDNDQV
ncbi:bidirectional sugar transporter NEC1-like [Arachis ipaensis]|uniref:bidirectional sugar transporter NEC1-like n=1 Tax=Arachis ipaensis TaxID=130454 RepID=UPI000A2B8F7E|nr:bidirectional sugar transporter NEC1-like [Arachis ipaensis]